MLISTQDNAVKVVGREYSQSSAGVAFHSVICGFGRGQVSNEFTPYFILDLPFLNTPDSGSRALRGSGPGDCILGSLFGTALTEYLTILANVGVVSR